MKIEFKDTGYARLALTAESPSETHALHELRKCLDPDIQPHWFAAGASSAETCRCLIIPHEGYED